MASSPEKTYVRREHRFCLSELECLDVVISRAAEISSPEHKAELVDCSRRGMKLRVPIGLHFEESINVRLKYNDFEVWYDGVASVRHIRAEGDNCWVIGCAIEPEIREEIIAKLASSSGKERRLHSRFNVEGAGTIQRQGDTTKGLATLRNVSEGGFCVEEEHKHEPGDIVKLEIEDKHLRLYTIGACVRWQAESEDGYLTGCSFTNVDGFENLMACVSKTTDDETNINKEKLSRFVVLAAMLTMVLPPALSIILQSDVSATQSNKAPITKTVSKRVIETSKQPTIGQNLKNSRPENGDIVKTNKSSSGKKPVIDPHPKPENLNKVIDKRLSTIAPVSVMEEPTPIPETASPLSPMREWVDNSGQYRIMAELEEVGEDFIRIRKPDGTVKEVPMDRLSTEDIRYLLKIKLK